MDKMRITLIINQSIYIILGYQEPRPTPPD